MEHDIFASTGLFLSFFQQVRNFTKKDRWLGHTFTAPGASGRILPFMVAVLTDEAKACKNTPSSDLGLRRTDFRYWLWYRHLPSGKPFSISAKQGSSASQQPMINSFLPEGHACIHIWKGTHGCSWVAQATSASLPSWPAWQLASLPNLSEHSWHAWKVSLAIGNDFDVYNSYSYLTKYQNTRGAGGRNPKPWIFIKESTSRKSIPSNGTKEINVLLDRIFGLPVSQQYKWISAWRIFLHNSRRILWVPEIKRATKAKCYWCIILRSVINKTRKRKIAESNCFPLLFFSFYQYLFLKVREFYRALVK